MPLYRVYSYLTGIPGGCSKGIAYPGSWRLIICPCRPRYVAVPMVGGGLQSGGGVGFGRWWDVCVHD